MKLKFWILICSCIVCINTIAISPSIKSNRQITFDQIECLASNEETGGGKPFLKCNTGSLNVGIHGIYSIRWCGDCLFHRVLTTSDGDCRLN